jgi:hypothetical protein
MKVNELINNIKGNPNASMSKLIGVKQYLPFEDKIELVKRIVDKSSTVENGLIKINGIDQYYNFTVETIEAYTNIEFENGYEDYDALCAYGVLGSIIATFEGEYNMILSLVEMEKKHVLERNSVENQLVKLLNTVEHKVSQVADVIAEKASAFDFSGLNISEEDLKNLSDVIGLIK